MTSRIGISHLGALLFTVVLGVQSSAATAVTISSKPTGEIVWEQSQSFNLDSTAGVIWWYEGQGLPASRSVSASGTVSFIGAPTQFNVAGTKYELMQVDAIALSTLAGTSTTYCHDADIGSHCESFGGFWTSVQATFSTFSTPLISASNYWGSAAAADGWWCCIGIIPIPVAATTSATHGNTVYPSATLTYVQDDLGHFTSQREVSLLLQKNITIAMTGVQSDDTDAYIQETLNKWDGSVKLQYIYAPVPEPSSALLLGSGIAAVICLRKRPRR